MELLIDALEQRGYKIGLVTQSSQRCIDFVFQRLSNSKKITKTLSLYQHPELRPKPSPDGYIEILKEFNAEPKRSFILEDSNTGIQAAKAAGACVIGFRENLIDGYAQTDADVYADTMEDIIQIVEPEYDV